MTQPDIHTDPEAHAPGPDPILPAPPSPMPEGDTLTTLSTSTQDKSRVRSIPVRPEESSAQLPTGFLASSVPVSRPGAPMFSAVAPAPSEDTPEGWWGDEPYTLDQKALLPYVYWSITREKKIGVALFRPKGNLLYYDSNFRSLNGHVPPSFSGLLTQLHVNWYQFESFTHDLLDAPPPDPNHPGASLRHTTQTARFLTAPKGADKPSKDKNKVNAEPSIAKIFIQGTAGRKDNTLVVPRDEKIFRYRIHQIRLTGGQGQILNEQGNEVPNNWPFRKEDNQDLAEAIAVTIEDITTESVDTEVQTRIMDIFHHELNTPALTVDLRCRQLSSQINLQIQAMGIIYQGLDELLEEMEKTDSKQGAAEAGPTDDEAKEGIVSGPVEQDTNVGAPPAPGYLALLQDIREALAKSQELLMEVRKENIPSLQAEVRRIVNLAHTLGILLQTGKNKKLNFINMNINDLLRNGVDNGVAEVRDHLKSCNVTFYPLTPAILKSQYATLATRLSFYLAYEISPKLRSTLIQMLMQVSKPSDTTKSHPNKSNNKKKSEEAQQDIQQDTGLSTNEDFSKYLDDFDKELEKLGRLIVDDIVRVYQGTFWSTSHTQVFATNSIELCFNNIVKNAVKYTAAKYEARSYLSSKYYQAKLTPDWEERNQDSPDPTAPVYRGNPQAPGRVIIRVRLCNDNLADARETLKDFLTVYLTTLEDQYWAKENLANLDGLSTKELIKRFIGGLENLVAGYPFPADSSSTTAAHLEGKLPNKEGDVSRPEGVNSTEGDSSLASGQAQIRPRVSCCNTEVLLINYFRQHNTALLFYKNLEITVTDNGKGISEKDRNYVFGLGYRVDKSGNTKMGGMGIGLKLAKIVTSFLDGDISIRDCEEASLIPPSNPGGKAYWWDGSSFHITLPTVEHLASEINRMITEKDMNFLHRVSDNKQIYHKFYDFLLSKDAAVRGITRLEAIAQPSTNVAIREEPSGPSLYDLLWIWMRFLKDNDLFRMDQQIVPSKKVEESFGKVSD